VFGVFVDSNVEERGVQPLQRHGNVGDGSKNDFRVEMLNQMLVQATNVTTASVSTGLVKPSLDVISIAVTNHLN